MSNDFLEDDVPVSPTMACRKIPPSCRWFSQQKPSCRVDFPMIFPTSQSKVTKDTFGHRSLDLLGKLEEMTRKWHGNDTEMTQILHDFTIQISWIFLVPFWFPLQPLGKFCWVWFWCQPLNNESKPRCWIILCNVGIDIYFLLQFMNNCRFNGLIPKLIVKLEVQSGFKVSSPP